MNKIVIELLRLYTLPACPPTSQEFVKLKRDA